MLDATNMLSLPCGGSGGGQTTIVVSGYRNCTLGIVRDQYDVRTFGIILESRKYTNRNGLINWMHGIQLYGTTIN